MTAYNDLESTFRRIATVQEAIAMLNWDASAIMPPGGAASRGEQLATLRVINHEFLCAPEIGDLLSAAHNQAGALGDWQRANLREMQRRWRHAAAVPADLVAAHSRACSESETAWRRARPANDFAAALPGLEKVLGLTREIAAAKAQALGATPYEALLDQYEPGGSTVLIDRLFDELATFLPGLLDDVLVHQAAQPALPAPQGPFPIADQRRAALLLMEQIGFDFSHGRLDESAHPSAAAPPTTSA